MYIISVYVETYHDQINQKECTNFTQIDSNFIHGDSRKRPLDFDLHLALYLLQRESLPDKLLNPLKQWAQDNKTAGRIS